MRACGGLHGRYLAGPLADLHVRQVTARGLRLEAGRHEDGRDKGKEASDSLGTLHFSHWVPFEDNHLGFFTIFDGDFEKYIQDFADKTSFVFDALFPHVDGAPPTPWQRTSRRSISGHWKTTIRPLGSTAHIQASGFKTSEPCWPTIARHHRPPLDSGGASSPIARSKAACTPRHHGCFGGRGRVRARPGGHSGVHSPRLQNADGAAFPVGGRRSGTSAQATRTARKRRRIRCAANHDRRGLARRVRTRAGRQSRRCPASQARLLPQHRNHVARTGRAGAGGTRSDAFVQVVWGVHRRSRATSGARRRYGRKLTPELGSAALERGTITSS